MFISLHYTFDILLFCNMFCNIAVTVLLCVKIYSSSSYSTVYVTTLIKPDFTRMGKAWSNDRRAFKRNENNKIDCSVIVPYVQIFSILYIVISTLFLYLLSYVYSFHSKQDYKANKQHTI